MQVSLVHKMHFRDHDLKHQHRYSGCMLAALRNVRKSSMSCIAPFKTKSIVHYCTDARVYCRPFEADQARIVVLRVFVQPLVCIMGQGLDLSLLRSVRCFLHGLLLAIHLWIQSIHRCISTKGTTHWKANWTTHGTRSCAAFVQSSWLPKSYCWLKYPPCGQRLSKTVLCLCAKHISLNYALALPCTFTTFHKPMSFVQLVLTR